MKPDNRLIHKLRLTPLKDLPISPDDDPIMKRLKELVHLYLLHWIRYERSSNISTKNEAIKAFNKVYVKINQLRQKHWYWKNITN